MVTETSDAGPDAGNFAGEGEGEAGEGEGEPGEGEGEEGEGEPLDAGPSCSEATEGFGDECSSSGDPPFCGIFQCSPQTGDLACFEPPGQPNRCNVCAPLDVTAGVPGQPCGEYGCGIAACNDDGTATVCLGDHPRNECGGCEELFPQDASPGDVCSSCQTGTQVCTTDENALLCYRGRSADNRCGSCERCILGHARLSDGAFGGTYIGEGTLAIIEDVGGTTRNQRMQLVFDPLVGGPGLDGLPDAHVYLSMTDNPYESASVELEPVMASSTTLTLSDPHRSFFIDDFIDISFYSYVVVADSSPVFFLPLAAGPLVLGPPPTE